MRTSYDVKYYKTGNYRSYLSRKFDALAQDLLIQLDLRPHYRILDFGCGYGGLLYEFYSRGFHNIFGTDISNWAIEYGKGVYPEIADKLEYYNRNLLDRKNDIVLFLDVLEHMPEVEAESCLRLAIRGLGKFLVARIPVSAEEGEKFLLDVSNNDPTHINCHCREWWLDFLRKAGYVFICDLFATSIYTSDGVLAGVWSYYFNDEW